MATVISLISLAFTAVYWVLIAGILLSIIGHAVNARWLYHPIPQAVIGASDAICRPFRQLMERVGLPTRPLDFSPMLAIFAFRIAQDLLISMLVRMV